MVSNSEKYPLVEVMTCLVCGDKIIPHLKDSPYSPYRFYRCSGFNKGKNCNSNEIKADLLEDEIRYIVIEHLRLSPFLIYQEINNEQKRIEKLRKHKMILVQSYENGLLTDNNMHDLNNFELKLKGFISENDFYATTDKDDTLLKYIKEINRETMKEYGRLVNPEQLLKSGKNTEINKFYRKIINIEFNIKTRCGLINFFLLEGQPRYYKFSVPTRKRKNEG